MQISSVYAVYFSATGNTKKAVEALASRLAQRLDATMEICNFTLPSCREHTRSYPKNSIVVFGVPVYAGRIPNKILPAVQNLFCTEGALAIPVVTFGNRDFDDALIELRDVLEANGFHTIAGAAVVAEHSFSSLLAPGRPNEADLDALLQFADRVAEIAAQMRSVPSPVAVPGNRPVAPYHTPLDADGKPAMFLKAKPKTDEALCDSCGVCASVCPMGSIDHEHPQNVSGICIKCFACIKSCPSHAKRFDDPVFLSHIARLEHLYTRPAVSEFFLSEENA